MTRTPVETPAICGRVGFWFGPLSQRLVCGREFGHTGTHIDFLPSVSVGFTESREDGTVVLAQEGKLTTA